MIRRRGDEREFLVVDCHTHVGESSVLERYRHNMGRRFGVDQLLEHMDRHGIDATVAFPVADPATDYSRQNALVLEAASQSGGRLIPFARINPHFEEDIRQRVAGIAESGFAGLKLHPFLDAFPINDPVLVRPVIEEASKHSLAVLFHTGEAWTALPGLVYDLALDFPNVQFIVGHSGHRGFDIEATALARRTTNLWLDSSVLYPPQRVAKVVQGVGSERVLFGSDTPFGVTAAEIEKLLRFAGLDDNELQQIFGENAAEMLGINAQSLHTGNVVDYPLQ